MKTTVRGKRNETLRDGRLEEKREKASNSRNRANETEMKGSRWNAERREEEREDERS